MHTVYFTLALSREEMLRWYRGEAHRVVVTTDQGLRVQLPAETLRPFVTPDGVSGRFALQYNGQGRLVSLRRVVSRPQGRVI